MTWARVVAIAGAMMCLPAIVKGQEAVNIDLGGPTPNVTLPGNVGTAYRFILLNAIPGKSYEVRVEQRIIRIPEIPAPKVAKDASGALACGEASKLAAELPQKSTESDIKKALSEIEQKLEGATCDPTTLKEIAKAVGATVVPVQGSYTLRAGSELVVTVSRGEKKWTLTISAGERGIWLTTYGVGIMPNRNDRVFLTKKSATEFAVTDAGDESGVVAVPSVLFHWLPTASMLSNFSFSITGGLGVSKDRPAFILGGGIVYNWNLMIFGGLGVTPHLVRKPEYTAGRILGESLSEDQLNDKQLRPSLVFGGSFRFGGNPFKGDK